MSTTSFNNWQLTHPNFASSIIHREGNCCRWGRIHAVWNEKVNTSGSIAHRYAFTIDKKTGDLYLDCRKRKIWAKFIFLSVGYPLFGFLKTLYHLAFPLSLPIELFKAMQKGRRESLPFKEFHIHAFKKIIFSLLDTVRTPFYHLVLSIFSIAALIIGPFAPIKLYDFRTLAAKLESDLYRQDEAMALAPCFHSIANVMTIGIDRKDEADDSIYEANWDNTMKGLSNLARSCIWHRRKYAVIFNDCGMLLQKGKPFISSAVL